MVKYFKLDKIFVEGTTYQTPPDRFYIVKKEGTDSATGAKLVIGGVETGEIINTVAPLHKTSSNLLGPLDLGDLYYFIPPDKQFWIKGGGSDKMRLMGRIGVLAPGEAVPGQFMGRYDAQGKHYITYVQDSVSLGTDVAWGAGVEHEVFSLTPKTIEVYRFNNVMMASLSGGTFAEGDFAVRLFMDGTPLDILTTEPGKKGIDVLSMPHPPAATTEEIPFTLADLPIEVLGDHTFTIKGINVSGASKSPDSGASWTLMVTAIVEYLQK